jgi:hypothetical protein
MAIIYPPKLGEDILDDLTLKGERDTYEALSKLTNDFEIFYNRCAYAGAVARAYERQIDFIIIHRALGLLAIEVKGGKLRLGTQKPFDHYISIDAYWKPIDPHKQVKQALRELIRTIKIDSPNYWIPDNVCVFFPHTLRSQLTDNPVSLPNGTLCAEELPILHTMIPQLMATKKGQPAWKESTFLDIRRRLIEVPQAKREQLPLSHNFHKRPKIENFTKPTKSNATNAAKPFLRDDAGWVTFDTIDKHQNEGTPNFKKPRPLAKQRLHWSEIIIAALAAIIAFCLVSLTLPNSPIQAIFLKLVETLKNRVGTY